MGLGQVLQLAGGSDLLKDVECMKCAYWASVGADAAYPRHTFEKAHKHLTPAAALCFSRTPALDAFGLI
jgi:hypothetical protein